MLDGPRQSSEGRSRRTQHGVLQRYGGVRRAAAGRGLAGQV